MPLNNLPDLASMGDLPFNLYQAGTQQVKDVQQFNQGSLKEQTLANLLSEQMNPLKVQNQELVNQGIGFDNDKKGVEARIGLSTENEAREAKRAELLKAATQNDLDRLIAEATTQTYSNDPAIRSIGQKKLDSGYAEILRRRKYQEELDAQKAKDEAAFARTKYSSDSSADASRYATDARERLGKERGALTGDMDTDLMKAKTSDQRISVLEGYAGKARKAGDDSLANDILRRIEYERQVRLTEKQAAALTQKPNQIDVPGVAGLPVAPPTPPLLPPRPSGAPPKAPTTVKALPAGSKQIGTSKGRPVYQTPDGRKFIGD